MKVLTLNFLTCARKSCKSSAASFPLHPRDAELEALDVHFNLLLLQNLLPRLEWPALVSICNELGLPGLPAAKPEREDLVESGPPPSAEAMDVETTEDIQAPEDIEAPENGEEGNGTEVQTQSVGQPSKLATELHRMLLETSVKEGKLVCGNCEHAYEVREGIANFLLPAHMV